MAKADEVQKFSYFMKVNGVYQMDRLVPPDLCASMKQDILDHYEKIVRPHQIKSGLGSIAQWSAHHICGRKDRIHEFLELDYFHDYVTAYFGGKPYILNSIGAAINPPVTSEGSYEHGHRWHRDGRTFVGNGNRQMIVAVVILDDSTTEHGTLEVLKGSHQMSEFPLDDFIKDNHKFICGPRGSSVLIDGDLWHRVGRNLTTDFCVVVTCVFSRPYFKQGMDYPRFLSLEYADNLSQRMRQLFGFNARTPSSYEEWYQSTEKRFYKSDQE